MIDVVDPQLCDHTWEGMIKCPAKSAPNYQVRRCPNPSCDYSDQRMTKKGWWNVARATGAIVTAVAAVVIAVNDDTPQDEDNT